MQAEPTASSEEMPLPPPASLHRCSVILSIELFISPASINCGRSAALGPPFTIIQLHYYRYRLELSHVPSRAIILPHRTQTYCPVLLQLYYHAFSRNPYISACAPDSRTAIKIFSDIHAGTCMVDWAAFSPAHLSRHHGSVFGQVEFLASSNNMS